MISIFTMFLVVGITLVESEEKLKQFKKCNISCSKEYRPVCGMTKIDNTKWKKIYFGNRCLLNAANKCGAHYIPCDVKLVENSNIIHETHIKKNIDDDWDPDYTFVEKFGDLTVICPLRCSKINDPVCGMKVNYKEKFEKKRFNNACTMENSRLCEGSHYLPCDCEEVYCTPSETRKWKKDKHKYPFNWGQK